MNRVVLLLALIVFLTLPVCASEIGIDTDNIELENPEDLGTVIDRIEGSLNGLF